MTRIKLTFNLSLEREYIGHPFNQRHILLLVEAKESWQKKVALNCPWVICDHIWIKRVRVLHLGRTLRTTKDLQKEGDMHRRV